MRCARPIQTLNQSDSRVPAAVRGDYIHSKRNVFERRRPGCDLDCQVTQGSLQAGNAAHRCKREFSRCTGDRNNYARAHGTHWWCQITADDKVLLHQCSTILLHNPNEDDIATVAEALRIILAETT